MEPDAHEIDMAKRKPSILTLQDILPLGTQAKSPPCSPLSLNQRVSLSSDIASSVLQLHLTPWLYASITNDAIYFEDDPTSSPDLTIPETSTSLHPFIRQRSSASSDYTGIYSSSNPRRCIHYLGIILLEL
ncbi:hypothetical protein BJX70DRAFT_376591 [Aspergillus crustosus]